MREVKDNFRLDLTPEQMSHALALALARGHEDIICFWIEQGARLLPVDREQHKWLDILQYQSLHEIHL